MQHVSSRGGLWVALRVGGSVWVAPSFPTGDAVEADMLLFFDVDKRRRRSRSRGPNFLSSFARGLPLLALVPRNRTESRDLYVRSVEGLAA
jgi:hypothetical protein